MNIAKWWSASVLRALIQGNRTGTYRREGAIDASAELLPLPIEKTNQVTSGRDSLTWIKPRKRALP
jgi:hypothetical protein